MDEMCRDTYTPQPPYVAECPHCGAGCPGDLAYLSWLVQSVARYRCGVCGREWSEERTSTAIQRLWTRAPGSQHRGRVA